MCNDKQQADRDDDVIVAGASRHSGSLIGRALEGPVSLAPRFFFWGGWGCIKHPMHRQLRHAVTSLPTDTITAKVRG